MPPPLPSGRRNRKKCRPRIASGAALRAERSGAKPLRLPILTCLNIEDEQKHRRHEDKQERCHETKIINLHSCLVRKSSSIHQCFHHIRGGIASAAGMRNASNFVTLLFGFGGDADGTIDDRLAGEAIVVRFVLEPFDFDRRAGGEVFQTFDHFHDTGAALAKAAAVHHLAHHRVEVDAIFDRFDPQVGPAGGHHFLGFIDEFDVGACDELGLLLRVHKPSLVAEDKCYGWKILDRKFRCADSRH
jgi:hypothetical protein